jgi:hypothetical protein
MDPLNYFNFIIVMVLLIPILITDISNFRKERKIYQLTPGLPIIGTVVSRFIQREKIGYSITVLNVGNLPGARNVWHFEFREKGRHKLIDYNLFGQTLYYGRYAIQHNSIILTRSNYDGDEKNFPALGVIRKDTVFWIGSDTMIIEKTK